MYGINENEESNAPWIQSYPLGKYISKIAIQKTKVNNDDSYLIHVIRANSSDYVFGFYATCNGIKNILHKYKSIRNISLIGSSLARLFVHEVAQVLNNYTMKKINVYITN